MLTVCEQHLTLFVSLSFAVITVDAAGRAFPIESENYATEQFHRINPQLVLTDLQLYSPRL